jgi:MerR family transcriptional regulator, copper efflux regulator
MASSTWGPQTPAGSASGPANTTLPIRHLPVADAVGGPRRDPLAVPRDDGDGERAEKLLLVGDIARASGKTVRAIHHYEELGLLRPHARSKGRYRLYDHNAVSRVRWIGKLHDLGLSLSEIQEMVATWEQASNAPGAMAKIRGIYLQKLEETRAQIAHLASLERELVASIGYLDTCDSCDPAELVAACCNCNVHDRSQGEPELVAGIHSCSSKSAGITTPVTE